MPSRVEPTHDKCGAPGMPARCTSSTVDIVPSRVEPPAPNVTLMKSGFNAPSSARVALSFSTPSGVLGGKNSQLNVSVRFMRARR